MRQQPDEDGRIECEFCGGTGRERRGGANDPNARTVGPCGYCGGEGRVYANEIEVDDPTDEDKEDVREVVDAVVEIFNSHTSGPKARGASYPLSVASALAILVWAFDTRLPGFRNVFQNFLETKDHRKSTQ